MYTAAAAPACIKNYKIIDHCSGIYVAMMIYSVILDCNNAALQSSTMQLQPLCI